MKRLLFLLSLVVVANCATAQNWQCLDEQVVRHFHGARYISQPKHYGSSFLRGMKIDSIEQVGVETVFYPFRTPRGGTFTFPAMLDSNGGSWLGKEVWLKPDGEMLFDTYWGDTVFIKTRAAVGDSWTFYNDTSSRYYMATVISADTATVLGALDSIKTIKITAFSNGQPNTTDLADNQSIILSKNHGFFRTFSLYMFPFHPSDIAAYQYQHDYIMDRRDVINGEVQTYQLFHLNVPPLTMQPQFEPGDVYHYQGGDGIGWPTSGINYFRFDSVLSKTNYGPGLDSCLLRRIVIRHRPPTPTLPSGYYDSDTSFVTISAYQVAYVDTTWYQDEDYEVVPDDTSWCKTSVLIRKGTTLWVDAWAIDYLNEVVAWKEGAGMVDYWYDLPGMPAYTITQLNLVYARRNGLPCGNYLTVGIASPATLHPQVFPNPTTGTIRLQAARPVTIAMYDVYGRLMTQTTEAQQQQEISLHQQPAGIYTIRCVADDGVAETVKVVKE